MLNALVGHRTQRLTRLDEKFPESLGERKAPDRGQVGGGSPGEVEAIGGRFGGRPLVRQDPPGLQINHLETPEHTSDVAPYAGRIREAHPIDREGWFLIDGK